MQKTNIRVRDAMTMHPITIDVGESLRDCAKLMKKYYIGGVLVVKDKNNLQGIITEQDMVHKVVAEGSMGLDVSVENVMETDIITVPPDIDISEAIVLMRDEDIRHLPVIENGKLKGIITVKDILKIEPHLFDYVVAKFELREAKNKPLFRKDTGICEICGRLTDKIYDVKGSKVCDCCRDSV